VLPISRFDQQELMTDQIKSIGVSSGPIRRTSAEGPPEINHGRLSPGRGLLGSTGQLSLRRGVPSLVEWLAATPLALWSSMRSVCLVPQLTCEGARDIVFA